MLASFFIQHASVTLRYAHYLSTLKGWFAGYDMLAQQYQSM